jgi:hypothetical protein
MLWDWTAESGPPPATIASLAAGGYDGTEKRMEPAFWLKRRTAMPSVIDEARLKELVKEALQEILEERKDLFADMLAEAIEEIALARAVQEGENSLPVSQEEILRALRVG